MRRATTPASFDDAAPFYSRFRAPYAAEALDWIIASTRLGGEARVLDLGCGPATLAIPLSRHAAEVVAIDPSAGMLAEARRLAREAGAANIRWVRSRAEDLPVSLEPFRLATLGLSFHWMDRDRVLDLLADLVAPGGAIAILDQAHLSSQESWEDVAAEIIERHVGPMGRHPGKHPETDYAPALLRSSCFAAFSVRTFGCTLERDIGSILGCLYSGVGLSRAILGDRAPAFEADLAAALLRVNPSGVFRECVETQVCIAPHGG